jgi:hypothetical protein
MDQRTSDLLQDRNLDQRASSAGYRLVRQLFDLLILLKLLLIELIRPSLGVFPALC